MSAKAAHNALTDDAKALRKEAGKLIARLRKEQGLSQKKISDALGFEYYTTISQWERGFIRIPSESYGPLAHLLGQDPDEFTLVMMKHYEPHLHRSVTRLMRKARKAYEQEKSK